MKRFYASIYVFYVHTCENEDSHHVTYVNMRSVIHTEIHILGHLIHLMCQSISANIATCYTNMSV
jgi:hypothetical protein